MKNDHDSSKYCEIQLDDEDNQVHDLNNIDELLDELIDFEF